MIRSGGHRDDRTPKGLSPWSLCLLCGLCVSALAADAQQLYKCTLANGRVQYQQEPCHDAARQSTVRPPDPIAPKSDAEQKAASDKSAAAAELQMGQVIVTIAGASVCAGDAPGWDAKYGAALQAWKNRNGAMVAKFDSDAEARAKALAYIESERARFGANKAGLAEACEGIGSRLGAPAAAPAAAKK
jgi:hypothetical protein